MAGSRVGSFFWGLPSGDTTYAFDRLFTYRADAPVAVGCRVLVPFGRGNRERVGMVLECQEPPAAETAVKPVLAVLDALPVLRAEQLDSGVLAARNDVLHVL